MRVFDGSRPIDGTSAYQLIAIDPKGTEPGLYVRRTSPGDELPELLGRRHVTRDVDFGHVDFEVRGDQQLVGRYMTRDGRVQDTFTIENRTPAGWKAGDALVGPAPVEVFDTSPGIAPGTLSADGSVD